MQAFAVTQNWAGYEPANLPRDPPVVNSLTLSEVGRGGRPTEGMPGVDRSATIGAGQHGCSEAVRPSDAKGGRYPSGHPSPNFFSALPRQATPFLDCLRRKRRTSGSPAMPLAKSKSDAGSGTFWWLGGTYRYVPLISEVIVQS